MALEPVALEPALAATTLVRARAVRLVPEAPAREERVQVARKPTFQPG